MSASGTSPAAAWDPGDLAGAVERRLETWQADRAGERLWRRDPGLWSSEPVDELVDRLGWLELPRAMDGLLDELEPFARAAAGDGLDTVVLLGMGGSSLGAEMLQAALGDPRRLRVADSTHPDAVASLADELDPDRAIFVVSSKSGGTVETDSLMRFFLDWLERRVERPGQRFVAVTDAGSALAETARRLGFRRLFEAPADVGGRYSVLGPFGLVPAALAGLELRDLAASAGEMARRCGPEVAAAESPGLALGALLGEAAAAGRWILRLAASPPAGPLLPWLEQLIAESTGKEGRGVLPVRAQPLAAAGPAARSVEVTMGGEPSAAGGPPLARLRVANPAALGGEIFRWQVAVAMASAAIGVHPFNQPDVQLAKRLAQRAARGEDGAEPPPLVPAAEAEPRGWRTEGAAYCSIHAFLAPRAATTERLERLRRALGRHTGLATTVDYGPRFLHSTGQLHKGGPAGGWFLQLVDRPGSDTQIPGSELSFGRLLRAQADGDAAALEQRGRSLTRIDLGDRVDDELERLAARLEGA